MANLVFKIAPTAPETVAVNSKNQYVDIDSNTMYSSAFGQTYVTEQLQTLTVQFIKYIAATFGIPDSDTLRKMCRDFIGATDLTDTATVYITLSDIFYNDTTAEHVEKIAQMYNAFLQEQSYNIKKLTDVESVKNGIRQIFTWLPGERILNPEFGSKLRMFLYEQITDENHENIMAEIRKCITKWEPRVSITDIRKVTTVDDRENNTVHIEIDYRIRGFDDQTYTYSYEKTAAQA